MNKMLQDTILAACEVVEDKKYLSCGKAFQIARDNQVSIKEIGDFCETQRIRIASCQLGCF